MKIELCNVVPEPLAETLGKEQGLVWNCKCEFSSPDYFLVKAPSGKGKSTLLNIIHGNRHDYSGSVHIDGRSLHDFSLNQLAAYRKMGIAMVFQDLRLFNGLSVMENLLLKANLTESHTSDQIYEMIIQLGIEEKANFLCGKLSFGQQQRVAIIRSLLQPFSFIILDEPFSHLDEENQMKASELIDVACKKNNAGMLLTSLSDNRDFNFKSVVTV